jgi:homoserine kinase type II
MAVYTRLTSADIHTLTQQFGLGTLLSFQEIAEGVENSNFLVITHDTHTNAPINHILTLFEKRLNPEELPFFLKLMQHLYGHHIPCPQPLLTPEGHLTTSIHGKTAAIVTFLHGKSTSSPTLAQMHQLGIHTARLHRASADFPMRRTNDLSLTGWQRLIDVIGMRANDITPDLAHIFNEELQHLRTHWHDTLPSGIIHADIFQDNVFFQDDNLTGIIDFYFACTDAYAYEIAIIINAWCFDNQQHFNPAKAQHFLQGYQSIRPLTDEEHRALPTLLRGSALRFLLTRTHDWVFHDTQALVTPKAPKEYLHKLQWHRANPHALTDLGSI